MTTPTTPMKIPFGRPWITDDEKNAVLEVLAGDVLTHGPQNDAFEKEFLSFVKGKDAHAVPVSSGMAALHLFYFQSGIGAGDEVLVPALTHVATAHSVELVGAKPVFVDCDPKTGNIDPLLAAKKITKKTKAISLVHFLGIPCRMDQIMELAKKHGLLVLEDCALAIGTKLKGVHAGLWGDGGCFSFYPVKLFTTGEGGMFLTRHKEIADKVRKARGFGVDRTFSERTVPGMYDVLTLGMNYRMSDINASIGRAQLKKLDQILSIRKKNFDTLKATLGSSVDFSIIDSTQSGEENSHYCLSAVLKGKAATKRFEIVSKLKELGVGTSIYYPQPVPRMTYYKSKYGFNAAEYPNATEVSDHSIALPVGPHLNVADMEFVGQSFLNVLKEV